MENFGFIPSPTGKTEKNDFGFKLDQSSATLAHSQAMIDHLRVKQVEAQRAAQVAKAPTTIAKETAKGVGGAIGGMVDSTIKGLRTGVQAVGEMFGAKNPVQEYTGVMGTPQRTIQGDVIAGEKTPLQGLGEFALEAGSVLPIGKAAQLGAKAIKPVGNMLSKAVSPITNYLAKRADTKAVDTLTSTLMPKPNAKEVKLALKEGRIQPGRDPSLLRGGTPDEIMPSENTKKSASTIRQYIQGAEKLKAPELHTKVGEQVKVMGTSLRPVMDATPITPKTVSKITKDWEVLKAKQLSDPYTPATANVKKLQADFENNFLRKSKSGNFGDLWDTRIAYDASVPANVKNATSLSSDTLQTQKELWLQNRRVLNDAINDAKTGLGEVSSKTFEEMNDLYNAQKGIESSYKPVTESVPSKIKDFAKEHPFITGGALYGANEASKKTTGVGIPTPF